VQQTWSIHYEAIAILNIICLTPALNIQDFATISASSFAGASS
jgi:hypothetical protein